MVKGEKVRTLPPPPSLPHTEFPKISNRFLWEASNSERLGWRGRIWGYILPGLGIHKKEQYSLTCYWWAQTENSQKSVNNMSHEYCSPLGYIHVCRNSNVISSSTGQILISVCETGMTSLYLFVTAVLEKEKWKYAANDFVYVLLPCPCCSPTTST